LPLLVILQLLNFLPYTMFISQKSRLKRTRFWFAKVESFFLYMPNYVKSTPF